MEKSTLSLTSLPEHSAVHPLDEERLSAAFVLPTFGRFYRAPVIDCFMFFIKATLEPVVTRLIGIFVQHSGGSHYAGLYARGQHPSHPYLIGSCCEDCGDNKLCDWTLGGLESSRFRGYGLYSCKPWGRREKERNTGRVVLVELVSVSDLSLHVSPETIFPQPKRDAHKDNLTMFLLHFPPELNSIHSVFLCGSWLWCPFSLISLAPVGF